MLPAWLIYWREWKMKLAKRGRSTSENLKMLFGIGTRAAVKHREKQSSLSSTIYMKLERHKMMAPHEKIETTELTAEINVKTIVVKVVIVVKIINKKFSSWTRLF